MQSAARHKLELAVEYGQIMESVKMKVSDTKEETRENRKCAIRDSSEAESNGHWVRARIVHRPKRVLLEPCQKGKVPLGQI